MVKETYDNVNLELIVFEADDVIVTSLGSVEDDEGPMA